MSTATITRLRRAIVTRLAHVPDLDRAGRKAELERITEDTLRWHGLSGMTLQVALAVYACPDLTPAQAMERWDEYMGERRCLEGIRDGDPDWAGYGLEIAEEDTACAMADLLDGSDTLHGDRTGDRVS